MSEDNKIKSRLTSRKFRSKKRRTKHHELGQEVSDIDAYFDPAGKFTIRFLADDRQFNLTVFDETQADRIAERLLYTASRAQKRLNKKAF